MWKKFDPLGHLGAVYRVILNAALLAATQSGPPKRQDSRPDVSHDSRDSVYNIHRECYQQP